MSWLVLLMTLPPTPSRNRVGIWRKLRRLGAVSLKGAAWLLPETEETTELAQWLLQEVATAGGEGALIRAHRIEALPQRDVVTLFHEARTQDYELVLRQIQVVANQLDKPGGGGTPARNGRMQAHLTRIKRELDHIARIDYFDTPLGKKARQRYEEAAMKLRAQDTKPKPARKRAKSSIPPAGASWVTRPRPHIDRIASAWLITRFHDGKARFVFSDRPESVRGGVPFDVLGTEFGHHGEDCTFETLVKRIGIKDRRVQKLAEIVHEADLRDGKYPNDQSAGLDAAIRGMVAAISDDSQLLEAGMTLFDGLYADLAKKR